MRISVMREEMRHAAVAAGHGIRAASTAFAQSWWAVLAVALLTGLLLDQRWQATHPHLAQPLKRGEHLRAVLLEGLDHGSVPITWSADGRPTVLYVFSPSCVWCKRNIEAAKALARGSSPSYRFIGVSLTLDGLGEYLGKVNLGFPVYVAGPAAAALKLKATPETIIVSPGGVVVKVWLGAYMEGTLADVERTFGVKLPSARIE